MTDGRRADFDAFDSYLALPRVTELALSPDGARLVATVAALNTDGNAFVSALWEVDPAGERDARQLTRPAKGDSSPAFANTGDLLFLSRRGTDDDTPASLWLLPTAGEAREVLARPGAVGAVLTAREAGTVVVATEVLPSAADREADDKRRKARKDAKVGAVLHTSSLVRYWDHDLGPDETRLFALAGPDGEPRDLTPAPGRALDEAGTALTPDGATLVATWNVIDEPGMPRAQLVAIDTATGERRVLADDPMLNFASPAVSRDGRQVVCTREVLTGYDSPPRHSLWLLDLAGGEGRELVTDPDVWPQEPQFAADRRSVFFLADELGHRPVFRLDLATGQVTRVTAHGHHANLQVAADGTTLYALRDHVDCPPTPVRLDATAVDGAATVLRAPGAAPVPGRVENVAATAVDGTPLRAWLCRPDTEDKVPLLVWIHGGPLSSWNSWSWRWNPWLTVAKGYAVLLPDPAFSTGYGERMIARGWGQWGGNPFTDLMALTDAAAARPDIDETTTAAMGGSYGGYMANWVATHTDRFRCIVTHASLWALDQFQATTDFPGYWVREWGLIGERPERYERWSPHRFVDAITTPMLVVHGDKDYRVPVGEGLRLWTDLQRAGVECKYLYFPDEGHWILKPGNARVWYETVWAWLALHLRGEPWQQPSLL
ncbi:MAG: S9 family peptidase [Jatrophihabitans sp.]|nr:MAG: S9 family peptidase [Jatrophihabitans sp.]